MKNIIMLSLLSLFLLQSNANADKLLVERIINEPPNSLEGIPRPRSGMSAKRVKEIFGKPEHISKPVGYPPISRWYYRKFEVVFERDKVVNTVLKMTNEMFVSDK